MKRDMNSEYDESSYTVHETSLGSLDNFSSRQQTCFFASSQRLQFSDGLKYDESDKPQEASGEVCEKKKNYFSAGQSKLLKAELDEINHVKWAGGGGTN